MNIPGMANTEPDFFILNVIKEESVATQNVFNLAENDKVRIPQFGLAQNGRVRTQDYIHGYEKKVKTHTILFYQLWYSPGNVLAVSELQTILESIKPKYFLLVGIAGGRHKKNVELGDVVVADKIKPVDTKKITTDNVETYDYPIAFASESLSRDADEVSRKNWKINIKMEKPRQNKSLPNVHLRSTVLSGELHANEKSETLNKLLEKFPETMATEMEGAGVARAIQSKQQSGKTLIDFLMIRGISDFIDDKTERSQEIRNCWRPYAAHVAAVFAKEVIDQRIQTGVHGTISPLTQSISNISSSTRHITDLDKLEPPFLEDRVMGKFFESSTHMGWKDIKTVLDFSKIKEHLTLEDNSRIYIIQGRSGIGKTTYALWLLDEELKDESKKMVFLNPCAHEQWAEELSREGFDPRKTLLVVDALKRSDTDFQKACKSLFDLALGVSNTEGSRVGPFQIIVTLKNDDYVELTRHRSYPNVRSYVKPLELKSENLDLGAIVRRYLKLYKLKYSEDEEDSFVKMLVEKSEGLPYYIHHVVAGLAKEGVEITLESLDKYPAGMTNLIWMRVKDCSEDDDNTIPFLLLMMLRTSNGFSFNFCELVSGEIGNNAADRNLLNLARMIEERSSKEGITTLKLDSHWRQGLEDGLKSHNRMDSSLEDISRKYDHLERREFSSLKKKIMKKLKSCLSDPNVEDAPILCLDLAKMGERDQEHEEFFVSAVDYYKKYRMQENREYLEYLQQGLYELSLTKARAYRNEHRYDMDHVNRVIRWYKYVFDEDWLCNRTDPKQLTAFVSYLQRRQLRLFKKGTQEYKKAVDEIERYYEILFSLLSSMKNDNPKEYSETASVPYFQYGKFYEKMEKFQEAIQWYDKSLEIKSDDTITLHNKGRLHRKLRQYDEAIVCFEKALELEPHNVIIMIYLVHIYNTLGKNIEKEDPEAAELHFGKVQKYDELIIEERLDEKISLSRLASRYKAKGLAERDIRTRYEHFKKAERYLKQLKRSHPNNPTKVNRRLNYIRNQLSLIEPIVTFDDCKRNITKSKVFKLVGMLNSKKYGRKNPHVRNKLINDIKAVADNSGTHPLWYMMTGLILLRKDPSKSKYKEARKYLVRCERNGMLDPEIFAALFVCYSRFDKDLADEYATTAMDRARRVTNVQLGYMEKMLDEYPELIIWLQNRDVHGIGM